MPVFVLVETTHPLDAGAVQREAEGALGLLRLSHAEVSLVLADDTYVQALNRQWRRIDAPTDVLSFPQQSYDAPGVPDEPLPPGITPVLGDVVISVETAERQAKEQGHDLTNELRVLLAHGLCHLIGHDHDEPHRASEMRRAEDALLAAWKVDPEAGLLARAEPSVRRGDDG